MTPARLAHLRALCDAATPGPWAVYDRTPEDIERPGIDGVYAEPQGKYSGRIVETDFGCYPPYKRDAAFIAAARTALPEALDEIERLAAQVEALRTRTPYYYELTAERDALKVEVERLEERVSHGPCTCPACGGKP